MDFLNSSWPFIVGFILQGEIAMVLWFLEFANYPQFWIYISSICAAFSFLAFQVNFLIGKSAPKILQRLSLQKVENFLQKYRIASFHWMIILFSRFLYGFRTPIAIWFGLQRYSTSYFVIFNLLGTFIWIGVFFLLFYLFREVALAYLQNYLHQLYYVYLIVISMVILYKVIRWGYILYYRKVHNS